MLKNYLRIAIQSIRKNFVFSIINILGLSIGIACSILIFLFVWNEINYDKFNNKADRIYRLAQKAVIGNTQINQTWTSAPMPQAMYDEFPEVEYITRITDLGRQTVSFEDKIFVENNALMADSTFFDVFTFTFLRKSQGSPLNQPNKVVITESMSRKYFGDYDPIGKSLRFQDNSTDIIAEVSGVIKDVPANSHFHFDFVVSILSFKGYYDGKEWFNNNFRTYIVLQDGVGQKEFEAKIPAYTNKYLFNGEYDKISAKYSSTWEIYLQPLLDIHLSSDISGEFEPNGKKSYVNIFSALAIIVIFIACINFMNLSTAKSSSRAKEVGVRKVVGAKRISLIAQFLGESIITCFLAMLMGAVIAKMLLPYYNNLVGRHLVLNFFDNYYVIPGLIVFAVLIGVISGSYPSFLLSSFKPVVVLKGKLQGGSKSPYLRNTLVVVQFTISVFLIIGTFVINKQLDFLQNERLGFSKEQVIVLKNPYTLGKNLEVFKEEVKKIEGVESVSISTTIPGKEFSNIGFHTSGKEGFTLNLCVCDNDFQKVMKLDMVEGRFFSDDYPSDSVSMIINESALKVLEWPSSAGKVISDNGRKITDFNVIGVVKDFYYESKHQMVRPMALLNIDFPRGWTPNYISIRVTGINMEKLIDQLDKKWMSFSTGLPIDYTFLDTEYESLYKNERQTHQLFVAFSILAIFIACLGLLGLTSYLTEQRIKEIGIRKVMGATSTAIVFLLSSHFLKWVLAANILAWPLTYYIITKWLENFAYRVGIGWYLYMFAALLSIIITLVTISYLCIKAASRNPADSLRYE